MRHKQSHRGRSITIKVSARANVRSKASPEKLPSTTQPSPATASATRARKLALSELLPAWTPVERVEMHNRQAELSPELQGEACLAAALAANNNNSAHDGHRALFDGWSEKSTSPALQSWARLQRPVLARFHQLANLQTASRDIRGSARRRTTPRLGRYDRRRLHRGAPPRLDRTSPSPFVTSPPFVPLRHSLEPYLR